MTNKLEKRKDFEILGEGLKEVLSRNVGGQELQDRVAEYVKVKKLEEKIAREILELWENQSKTENYLEDLSSLISTLKKDSDVSK